MACAKNGLAHLQLRWDSNRCGAQARRSIAMELATGRLQEAVLRLVDAGVFRGSSLDDGVSRD